MNSSNLLGKRNHEDDQEDLQTKIGKTEVEDKPSQNLIDNTFFKWCKINDNFIKVTTQSVTEFSEENLDSTTSAYFFEAIAIVSNLPKHDLEVIDLERFQGGMPTPDILSKINLDNLKELNLRRAFPKARHCQNFILHFLQANSLISINLSGLRLNKEILEKITTLPNLKALNLTFCNLTINDLDLLPASTSLEILHLSCNEVADDTIASIAKKFPNLKVLSVGGNHELNAGITGECFHHLATLNQLEELHITHISLTKSFVSLIACSQITTLSLKHCEIRYPFFLDVLAEFSNLDKIDLAGTKLIYKNEPINLEKLNELNLISLNLTCCSLNPSQIKAIAKIDSIEVLSLEGNNRYEDPNIISAIQSLENHPNLRVLNLAACNLSSNDLDFLLTIECLTELNLTANDIDDNGAKKISFSRKVIVLNLSDNNIGKAGIEAIAKMIQLESLDLSETALNDESAALLQNLPQLKHFFVTDETDISPKMEYFFATFENLESFKSSEDNDQYSFSQLKQVNPRDLMAFVRSQQFADMPVDEISKETFDKFIAIKSNSNNNNNNNTMETGKEEIETESHTPCFKTEVPSLLYLTIFKVRQMATGLTLTEKVNLASNMPKELARKL